MRRGEVRRGEERRCEERRGEERRGEERWESVTDRNLSVGTAASPSPEETGAVAPSSRQEEGMERQERS